MRGLFIFACWILGLASVGVGFLSAPFTLGFSLVGGFAGFVFFGGLASFAQDLMETRELVQRMYDQNDRLEQQIGKIEGRTEELRRKAVDAKRASVGLPPKGSEEDLAATGKDLPIGTPLSPNQPDTLPVLAARYGIYAVAVLVVLFLIYIVGAMTGITDSSAGAGLREADRMAKERAQP